MSTDRRSLGAWGEDRAVAGLSALGYRVETRNWRCRLGEIDVIAWAPDGALCFIEVRTSRGVKFGGAVASVTARKRKRMVALASTFLADNALDVAVRFDVIAIQYVDGVWHTEHFEGAFDAE